MTTFHSQVWHSFAVGLCALLRGTQMTWRCKALTTKELLPSLSGVFPRAAYFPSHRFELVQICCDTLGFTNTRG
jgi:hypothetical protein